MLMGILLIATLFCWSCSNSTETEEVFVPLEDEKTEQTEVAKIQENIQNEIEAEEEVNEEDMDAMLPVFSVINAYLCENQGEYDGENPDFYWGALSYAISGIGPNYGELYGIKGEDVRLHRMVVEELASIFFPNVLELPKIPSSLKKQVWYNSNDDSYYCKVGEPGEVKTEIASYEKNDDGSVTVLASYQAGDTLEEIASFLYLLRENPALDKAVKPDFHYTIDSVSYELSKDRVSQGESPEDFAAKVQSAINLRDMEMLSLLIQYPFKVDENTMIDNEKEFMELEQTIVVTEELAREIQDTDTSQLLEIEQGYMIGEEQYNIWFALTEEGYKITGMNK